MHDGLQDNEKEETDGEDSQADSFVVADGYLSESERMDLEDIAAAVGGKISLDSRDHIFSTGDFTDGFDTYVGPGETVSGLQPPLSYLRNLACMETRLI